MYLKFNQISFYILDEGFKPSLWKSILTQFQADHNLIPLEFL